MRTKVNWDEQIDQWFGLPFALWNKFSLTLFARAASLFSLPIEGGFWSSIMNGGNFAKFAAYALPFTLDFIADLLVYRYGRIQQTVNKGTKKWKASRIILVFVFFNALQSWGTAAWQLRSSMPDAFIAFPILFAFIQPFVGAGVSWTLAVQDGKYDEEKKEQPKQPQHNLLPGKPDHAWWLSKIDSLNGQGEQITPDDVRVLVQAEWTDVPSGTTLYNWAREAKKNESS